MPDHWGFVAAAYGLTAAVLLIYWRRLATKEREVERLSEGRSGLNAAQSQERLTAERSRLTAERSREPSSSGHPRPDPSTRPPLQ
jgi:transposase-like protein